MKKYYYAFIFISTITNSIYSQINVTIGQIYNFNIGDVFQYTENYNNYPTKYITDTIISKSFSTNLDTVKYSVKNYIYILPSCSTCSPTVSNNLIQKTYYNLSNNFQYTNNSTCSVSTVTPCVKDTVVLNGYCLKTTYKSEWVGVPSPSVISVYTINNASYTEGLGEVYFYIEHIGNFDPYIKNMIFYNKGGFTCGNFYSVNIVESILNNTISIFPNPVLNKIFIKDDNNLYKNSQLYIFDILGNKLLSLPYNETINISDLSNGIYFLKVESDWFTKTIRFIKQ